MGKHSPNPVVGCCPLPSTGLKWLGGGCDPMALRFIQGDKLENVAAVIRPSFMIKTLSQTAHAWFFSLVGKKYSHETRQHGDFRWPLVHESTAW